MNLRAIVLLGFTTASAFGQQASPSKQLPNDPKTFVQSLYAQVVAHAPGFLLDGVRNEKIFDPYLSKSLHHRIDLASACSKDWFRQNHGQMVKPPLAWGEFGLFTGANERVSPSSFQIDKVHAEEDGSFRITVKLTYWPVDGSGSWRVTAIVVREDGRLALSDVIYLKDSDRTDDIDTPMSKILTEGCDGTHWVGNR